LIRLGFGLDLIWGKFPLMKDTRMLTRLVAPFPVSPYRVVTGLGPCGCCWASASWARLHSVKQTRQDGMSCTGEGKSDKRKEAKRAGWAKAGCALKRKRGEVGRSGFGPKRSLSFKMVFYFPILIHILIHFELERILLEL
jgi:hypothetical protein